MFVGGHECPKPEHVRMLMRQWEGWVKSKIGVPRNEVAEHAEVLHDILLAIHPYRDGNGRTARLFFNSFRLSRGLPWEAADSTYRLSYFNRLERMHASFKEMFPEVY
jgi:Fic family protein